MPLPDDEKTPWPPPDVVEVNEHFTRWDAWYSGSPDKLAEVYGGTLSTMDDAKGYHEQRTGLLSRQRERYFWGARRTSGNNTLREARLHVPLGGDISSTSADHLFGELPKMRPVSDQQRQQATPATQGVRTAPSATQVHLDMLLDEGGWGPVLLEAGEITAAYSGSYLRLGWDKQMAGHILLDVISPDHAVPEWRSGRLSAVTFWKVLERETDESGKVLRHLERHEVAGTGEDMRGRILHGLYEGTADQLGRKVDLGGHPVTEPFQALVGDAGFVETGARGLAVEYLPNMKPARALSGIPHGRSDFDGIEPEMDALDEVWTSLMRDIRIGKGRLLVPDVYLQDQGRGKGAVFDPEQEVYQTLNALPSAEGMSLQVVQFAIRVTEHMAAAKEIQAIAIRGAGYSVQSFGEGGDTVAATATEIIARDGRSNKTRGRKIGYTKPVLARLSQRGVEMQVAQFKTSGLELGPVQVSFPDGVANDPESTGRTLQLFHAAEAVSLYTRVKMANPDWEDSQIREEVDRIREDQRIAIQLATPVEPPVSGVPASPKESETAQ